MPYYRGICVLWNMLSKHKHFPVLTSPKQNTNGFSILSLEMRIRNTPNFIAENNTEGGRKHEEIQN